MIHQVFKGLTLKLDATYFRSLYFSGSWIQWRRISKGNPPSSVRCADFVVAFQVNKLHLNMQAYVTLRD